MSTDESQPALLVFSIGPVQDFIATARRTQDLWMGSYILSYLIAHAMRKVVANLSDPKEILFPMPADQPLIKRLWLKDLNVSARELTLATLPNKFTARFNSFGEAERRAQAAEEAMYEAWHNQCSADRLACHRRRSDFDWR
jgi:CRISPR-associated protein Cmr2